MRVACPVGASQVSGAVSTFLVNFFVAGAQSSVLSGMPSDDDFTETAKLIGEPTQAGNSRTLDVVPAIASRATVLVGDVLAVLGERLGLVHGELGERVAAHVDVGDLVAVEVEPHVDRVAGLDGAAVLDEHDRRAGGLGRQRSVTWVMS